MATFHFMAAACLAAVALPHPVISRVQENSPSLAFSVPPSGKYFARVAGVRHAQRVAYPRSRGNYFHGGKA